MDEILSKLVESELLSEDVKAEVTKALKEALEAHEAQVRNEVTLEVRGELAEQWVKERDALIESLEKFVTENMDKEIDELRGDIERFRDLEVEYAAKLVEEKKSLAEGLAQELDSLVDKISAFFEVRLNEEMEEFKEDLEIVKQNDFGRRVFEAFSDEFNRAHMDEDSIQGKLTVTEAKLADIQQHAAELESQNAKMIREAKMEQVLSTLTGAKREQMAFVLQNVETGRLDEAYSSFIGRILKDEDKEDKQIVTEATKSAKATVVKTGDSKSAIITEEQGKKANLSQLRALAGIK